MKTKPSKQVGRFMAFCYWYHCFHRALGPNAILDYYFVGDNNAEYEATRDIKRWLKKGPPRVHKQHFWAHVRPKGKRVDYAVPCREDGSDPIDDESNCFVDPANEDVWEPGYVDPRGISVEPNEEDGFVTDMDDHEYDSDEDTVHIEVEDIRRQLKRDAQERLDMVRPRRRLNPPAEIIVQVADMGAGAEAGQNVSMEA